MVLGIGEGKVELELSKTSFVPGESITGKVKLFLNEPEKAHEVRIEFYGEIVKRRTAMSGGHHHSSSTVEKVFLVQKQLDGERAYKDGETFDFSLTIPENALPPKPNGIVMSFMSFFTAAPRAWYVHATLDMPMKFDMNKKIQIFLSPKQV